METSHHLDEGMVDSRNLGKCTRLHDDLGSEFDGCPLFDSKNPKNKFCGACGCHMSFHVKLNLDSRDDDMPAAWDPKHKVFLSHSGKQKDFVEQLCVDLERFDRYAFFDKDQYSLPIGENFPRLIFKAIHQCRVGVVILSNDFFVSKWPMMELVAMVNEIKEREFSFKIIPVFLHTSLNDISNNSSKLTEWKVLWKKWELDEPNRINIEKCEATLKYLRPINGVEGIVYDKLGEVHFRKVIVDAICMVVPPEVKFEISHLQGSSRLCQVIQDKIMEVQKNHKSNEVCILGLYGMGGIGKTSICKVLYNYFFTKFKAKVCHAEFERKSKEELLRDVLERLTDTNPKLLDGRNEDELHDLLKQRIEKQPIFLALDNIPDVSMTEVERYLSQNFMPGSIVIVTSCSVSLLMRLINKNNCLEMPNLEIDEAKSLFAKSSMFDIEDEAYEDIITCCVKRCHFKKCDGNDSYHYHPLALDVLGRQLRGYDLKECGMILNKINEDIFNQGSGNIHPIFSILRTSYDSLTPENQLLFVDVALFLLKRGGSNYNVFEWLKMVHGIGSVDDVIKRLELLMRKSLLERLGDGIKTEIGVHDLWCSFCITETENGEVGCRRWVYNESSRKQSKLVETTPSGIWQSVERMALLDSRLLSLERINLAYFPNVTVLKLQGDLAVYLDLSVLIHLKSLEVIGKRLFKVYLKGALPKTLTFLSLTDYRRDLDGRIECLKELQYLRLIRYDMWRLPNMSNMDSLQVASIHSTHVYDVSKFSSNLRVLNLGDCILLRECPGVGDLVLLEELVCCGCERLKELPNLKRLAKLRKLDISNSPLINEVPGLGDLVALERLYAEGDGSTLDLPDMCNLTTLQVLQLRGRHLVAVPGFYSLISLREVVANFRWVKNWPNTSKLSPSGLGVMSIGAFTRLERLEFESLPVEELPDLSNFPWLKTLKLVECERLRRLTSCEPINALSNLVLLGCITLTTLPNLKMFPALSNLHLTMCSGLTALSNSVSLSALSQLRLHDCSAVDALPDLGMFPSLYSLNLYGCSALNLLSCTRPLTSLWQLNLEGCDGMDALPDLELFPELRIVSINMCTGLTALTSSVTLTQLSLQGCSGVKALPDLGMFSALQTLDIFGCSGLCALSSSVPLASLYQLNLQDCCGVKTLPDLGMFPELH